MQLYSLKEELPAMLPHLCEIVVCPFTFLLLPLSLPFRRRIKKLLAVCPFALPGVAIVVAFSNCAAAGHNNAADDCALDPLVARRSSSLLRISSAFVETVGWKKRSSPREVYYHFVFEIFTEELPLFRRREEISFHRGFCAVNVVP